MKFSSKNKRWAQGISCWFARVHSAIFINSSFGEISTILHFLYRHAWNFLFKFNFPASSLRREARIWEKSPYGWRKTFCFKKVILLTCIRREPRGPSCLTSCLRDSKIKFAKSIKYPFEHPVEFMWDRGFIVFSFLKVWHWIEKGIDRIRNK